VTGSSPFSLEGKVALITGAGTGIGRATATMMARTGAIVVATDRPGRSQALDTLVGAITREGRRALALELDVTAVRSMPAVFDRIVAETDRLDILVNNAGTQLFKAALDIEEEEFDAIMNVNLRGAFFCAQAAASVLSRGGTIINVCSQHGVVGNRDRAPYCASKGGLINLTRALAVEWADRAIRVNAVSPTYVQTESNAALLQSPPIRDDIKNDLPLGRPVTADEVAAAICYLASDAAAGVTGHNLLVDGGWTAR